MKSPINKVFVLAVSLTILQACAGSKTASDNEKKASIYTQAGIEALNLNDPTAALNYLQEALKLNPKSADNWSNLGLAYLGKGEERRAEDSWKKALSLDPNFSTAKANLGALYLKQGKFAEAEKWLKLVLKDLSYEKSEQIHFNLGILYLKIKRPILAETHFKNALASRPDYCGAWYQMGQIQKSKGEFASAAESFSRSVRGTCFRNPEAHYEISAALLKSKNTEKGKLKLLEIIQFFPESEWAKKAELTLSMMNN